MSNLHSSRESPTIKSEPDIAIVLDAPPLPQINLDPHKMPHIDTQSPYNVETEERPEAPFYTAAFQAAMKECYAITQDMANALKNAEASVHSSDMRRLRSDAELLSMYQSTNTRSIAVLGDSGDGKSSSINSLLHYPEIAQTGDIGSACTSVVTEYRQKTERHVAPITIEVTHLSTREIRELISELVWSYCKLYLPGVESDEISPEEYQRYERESELAWSTLEAAFKHRREFNRNLLTYNVDNGIDHIISQLIEWTDDIQWPVGDRGEDGFWASTAQTAEECCEKTTAFMQDRLWPFTKTIRVYLDSQVLKSGIVLADLPGLQDTNYARVKATQDYLLRCDHIFVITRISRAITDKSVKDNLHHVLSKHVPLELDGPEEPADQYLNVAVVCTHAEDINEKKARNEFSGPGGRIDSSLIDDLDSAIEEAQDFGDRKLKKRLQARRRFLFVAARNAHVREGLQEVYLSKVPGGRFNVFCISNTTYEKCCQKGETEMVHKSGVPELRRFCYTITAEAQLSEAKYFIQSKIGSMLHSFQIWANPRQQPLVSQAAWQTLERKMLDLESRIPPLFESAKARYTDEFSKLVLEQVDKRKAAWGKAAKDEAAMWYEWHWTQYTAWCRNYGNWKTKKRGDVNWNRDLIEEMRDDLKTRFTKLEFAASYLFEDLVKNLQAELGHIKTSMRDSEFPLELEEGIRPRVQSIEYNIDQRKRKFMEEVKAVRRKMLAGNADSYVNEEMIPCYRTASMECGKGMWRRQQSIIQTHITDSALFESIAAKANNDMHTMVQREMEDLSRKVREVLKNVRDDIELATTERAKAEEEARAVAAEKLKGLRQRYAGVVSIVQAVADGD